MPDFEPPPPFISDSSQPYKSQKPITHGWFSHQQASTTGKTFIYKQRGTDDDVIVSMVSKRAEGHGTKYEDVIYVGPVDTFVRFIDTNVV